jgi:PAS domain S-box-containing protein
MNLVLSQALVADPNPRRRARVRRELLRELPGIDVAEAADSHAAVQSLEARRFDLTILRHPLLPDPSVPLVLKKRWPEHVLLLYAPVESEHTLAEALSTAGDAYFLEAGDSLPGLRAALRLTCGRPGFDRSLLPAERLRSLEWLAAVFRASPIGIGLSATVDGRFFDANDRLLEMLGRARGDVLGRTWTELGIEADPEHALADDDLEGAPDGPKVRRVGVRFRKSSGEERQGLLSTQQIRLDGTSARLSLLDDLTDLRRVESQRDSLLESERRARAEAEAALSQLRESHDRLGSLSRRLVDVQEAERRFVARELHDEMGQILASLRLRLEGGSSRATAEVQSILGDLLARVRRLSMTLRPPTLDDLGLVPTLLWHFERYRAETGVRVDFHSDGPAGRFAPDVETTAFRIVQEALTNVARHSGVSEVDVRLEVRPDILELRIEDRGTGFEPATARPGGSGGLAGMQERARLLGGRVTIDSSPGHGTRVVAVLRATPAPGVAD